MAVVISKRGALNMSDLGFTQDGTVAASPSNIRLTYVDGGFTDFGGSYTFGPGGSVSGTVDNVSNFENGRETFTVSGVDADAQRLFALINAGDIIGAEAYVLRDDDTITGGTRADTLFGFGGNDTISGGAGRDILVGGEDKDRLTGGAGADRFTYWSDEDSGRRIADRDTIQDFSHADGDKIDLKGIDANEHTDGVNEAFTFVDHFSGHAGELLVKETAAGWLVQGDTDGRGGADFAILVKADGPVVEADFML